MNKKRILLATLVAFARLSFADLPNSGDGVGGELISPTVIEKLEAKWISSGIFSGKTYTVRPDGSLLVQCKNGCELTAKGQVAFATSGSRSHAPGTVELRIPAKAFTDRDGVKTGSTADLGVSSQDGWASRLDETTGEIVIYNSVTKPAAMEYVLEVAYACVPPHAIVDMAESGGFSATLAVADEGASPVTAQSNAVVAYVDTRANVQSVVKEPCAYYPDWQGGWGEAPADSADYFHVKYRIRSFIPTPSQPYVLTLDDIPLNGGEVVGFSEGYTKEVVGAGRSNIINFNHNDNAGFHGGMVFSCHDCGAWDAWNDLSCYINTTVLIRYPKSLVADGQEHVFTNSVVATVVGDDDHIPSVATNFTTFTYYGDDVVIPGELYSFIKSQKNTFNGGIDRLETGTRIEGAQHLLLGVANCYETTLAPGANPALASSYNQRTNSFELIDDFIRLADAPDRALTSDDFEFDSIEFCDSSFVSTGVQLKTNDLGRVSLSSGGSGYSFRDVKVWGKFDTDAWELIGTLERDEARSTGSLWRFLPAMDGAVCDGSVVSRPQETDPSDIVRSHAVGVALFKKIVLPDNCTGIRLTAEGAGCYIRLGSVYVSYSLKPSAFILSVVSGKRYVDAFNVGTFVVRDDEGRILGPCQTVNDSNSRHTSMSSALSSALADEDFAAFGRKMSHSFATTRLTPFEKKSSVLKYADFVFPDIDGKRIRIKYTLNAYEWMQSDLVEDPVVEGFFVPQTSGTFYDLLPLGMEIFPENTEVYRQGLSPTSGTSVYYCNRGPAIDASKFTVSTTPNWRGTGRTLVAVAIHDVDGNYCRENYPRWNSGFIVDLDAYYPWEAVVDYGKNLLNMMAYESGNDTIADGKSDSGIVSNGTRYLDDLDGDGVTGGAPCRYLYGYVYHSVDSLMSAEAGLTKRVRAPETGFFDWITGVARNHDGTIDLPAGTPYQYRLRTATTRDSSKKDIILYDSIENYVPTSVSDDFGNPQWRGALAGVDVSQIEKSGVAPSVYYSTVPRLDIEAHADLSDTATWSVVAPADLSAVTAIAIDCRTGRNGAPFVLEPEHSLVALINMNAPSDSDECARLNRRDAHAYNQVYEYSTLLLQSGSASTQMIHNEYTKVGLLPPPLPETYIHTEASDGADGDGEVAESSRVLVRDTVAYAGLVPGREYTLWGTLHVRGADGSDEGPLLVDGREVTAVKTFFPVASDGSVDVVFEFDASGLAGTTLVAFEELSAKGDPSEPRTLCSLLDFGQRFNAVVFGGLSAVGGDSEGALLVWGDANLGTGYSVGHAVVGDPTPPADAGRDALIVGGDLSMGWQSVNGNIVHGGAYTGADRSNQGYSVRQTAPVTIDGDGNVPMDGTGLARDAMLGNVREAVSRIVGLEVTGTVVAEDAVMTLCGDSMGLNVFEVSASDWSGNGIDRVFEVPAGSKSLVIVRGGSVEIRNGAMRLPEGVGPADVLVVYPDAASITFDSFSHEGSLLAPVASADFLGGAIQGVAIIGGDVAGSRGFEFHNFGFDVFACPEAEDVAIASHADIGDDGQSVVVTAAVADAADLSGSSDVADFSGSSEDSGSEGQGTTVSAWTPKADLGLTDIWFDLVPTKIDDTYAVGVKVVNGGDKVSLAATLALYDVPFETVRVDPAALPAAVATAPVPALGPGEETVVRFEDLRASMQDGNYRVIAYADPAGALEEYSLGDNQLSLFYQTLPVTISISLDGGRVTLSWNNNWGQIYTVMGSSDLRNWTVVEGGIPSARDDASRDERNVYTVPADCPYTFFRLRIDQR